VQHQSRLNEGNGQVDPASVQVQADAIRQLWQTVFGDA
jgi:hypothetical protein